MVQQDLIVGPYGPFDGADLFDFSTVGAGGQSNQVDDPQDPGPQDPDDGDEVYSKDPNDELGPGPTAEGDGPFSEVFLFNVHDVSADDSLLF